MLPLPAVAVTWTRVKEVPAGNVFSLHHAGTTLYAGGSNIAYVGAAEGTSWTPTAIVDPAANAIETVVPAGGALWVGTFGHGVFRSTDNGTSWSPVNTGLTGLGASQVLELVEQSDSLFAATGGAGVFALDLATPTQWSAFSAGIPISIAGTVETLVLHGTMLVATAGPNGFVYRFPDGATEWQEFNLMPPIAPGLLPTDLVTTGSDLFVGAPNRIFRSEDGAQTWIFVGNGIVQNSETFLAVDGTVLYAGVDFQGNNHRIYFSPDRGDSWQPFDEIPGVFLFALAVAGDKLFAARNDGLWWTPVVAAAVEETTWGWIKSRIGRP
jgi:photosystem II stability/assembly factor-like uncharacterized protein